MDRSVVASIRAKDETDMVFHIFILVRSKNTTLLNADTVFIFFFSLYATKKPLETLYTKNVTQAVSRYNRGKEVVK